jgi:hypothetical protein
MLKCGIVRQDECVTGCLPQDEDAQGFQLPLSVAASTRSSSLGGQTLARGTVAGVPTGVSGQHTVTCGPIAK